MNAARFLLVKDLRVLWRSPALLILLCAYPLLVSGLVGLVAGYANSKPQIALVDLDHLPRVITVGNKHFRVQQTIERVGKDAHVLPMTQSQAEDALLHGRVVGVITIPPGFVSDLESETRSPKLLLETARGGIAPRVQEQMEALVYSLNGELQNAYIETALGYANVLQNGGHAEFSGQRFYVLGLAKAQQLIDTLPVGRRSSLLKNFFSIAGAAVTQSVVSLHAVAAPIRLDVVTTKRSWLLSAEVQAYALALTVTFLALALAAAALAAERDENVAARLGRGLVKPRWLIAEKTVLAALLSLLVGTVIALAFGIVVELRDVPGGEPWARVPLVLLGVALAGLAVGSLGTLVGALARDGRSASLVAVLIALPIVLLGLVPTELLHGVGTLSDFFPFAHTSALIGSALYDPNPWTVVVPNGLWLAGLALGYGVLARLALPRLLTA